MPARMVACPTCGFEAPIPPDFSGPAVKCPRCQELVRNPEWKRVEVATPSKGLRIPSNPIASSRPPRKQTLDEGPSVGAGFRVAFGAVLGVAAAFVFLAIVAASIVLWVMYRPASVAPTEASQSKGSPVITAPPALSSPKQSQATEELPRRGVILAKTEGDSVTCLRSREAVLWVHKVSGQINVYDRSTYNMLRNLELMQQYREITCEVPDGTPVLAGDTETIRYEGGLLVLLWVQLLAGKDKGTWVLSDPARYKPDPPRAQSKTLLPQKPPPVLEREAREEAEEQRNVTEEREQVLRQARERTRRLADERAKAEAARQEQQRGVAKQKELEAEQQRQAKQVADVQKKEAAAEAKLTLVKQLIADGTTQRVKYHLENLLKQYPDTAAAKDAKKLLEQYK